jgi:hypothetical protein
MSRELHERTYARGRRASQRKKTALNHFFSPHGYPQLALLRSGLKSREAMFCGPFLAAKPG